MIDYEEIGRRIKAMRLYKKLTQEKLAELVDVSVSFIGHIERGRRIASLETMFKIAKSLDVPVGQILVDVDRTTYAQSIQAIETVMSILQKIKIDDELLRHIMEQ